MNRLETINKITSDFKKRLEVLNEDDLNKVVSGEYGFSLVKTVMSETGGRMSMTSNMIRK